MSNSFDKAKDLLSQIDSFSPKNAEELEQFRIHYLGSKGILKDLFSEIKNIPNEQKKEFGLLVNEIKQKVEEKYNSLKEQLEPSGSSEEKIDLTLPGEAQPLGTRHPISIIRNQIIEIFGRIGFTISEGPEIVDDWHNFTALNIPENHPARDMQDTFFIKFPIPNPQSQMVLRTHTSSVQVQEMQKGRLPIRSISPGRVYRNETISARAHCFFHQVEGLYVDENVSFADLKQTLYYFVREMFGENTQVRFRPSYFPFTEPSAEMDILCLICGGKGCPVCKQSGWVEILGCGMVHPKVLENCKIDSKKYTGFAFGMGVERITQLKYQINDLRLFSENDVRFLRQFASAM